MPGHSPHQPALVRRGCGGSVHVSDVFDGFVQPPGHDVPYGRDRLLDLSRGAPLGFVHEVDADAREASVEIRGQQCEVQLQELAENRVGGILSAERAERIGDAGESVIESVTGLRQAFRRVLDPVERPLPLRVRARVRQQIAARAVCDSHSVLDELMGVAGEDAIGAREVGALPYARGDARQDFLDAFRARHVPAVDHGARRLDQAVGVLLGLDSDVAEDLAAVFVGQFERALRRVDELAELQRVERDEDRQGEEQRELGAPQGVQIRRDPCASVAGHVSRGARRDDVHFVDGVGHLEVDEHGPAFVGDDDVVGVQVAEDDAFAMEGPQGLFDFGHDPQSPVAVGEPILAGLVGADERVAGDHRLVERYARHVVLHEEVMPRDDELILKVHDLVEIPELPQEIRFLLEAADGVPSVGGQPGVRAGLFEHRLASGRQGTPLVDAAAVGEMKGFGDFVSEFVGALPRSQRFLHADDELGQLDPLGRREGGKPVIRFELAVRPANRGDEFVELVADEILLVGSVTNVERPFVVSQIAEDVGAFVPADLSVEVVEDPLRILRIDRVYRDELSTASARRVLHVRAEEICSRREEFKVDSPAEAIG